MGDFRINQLGTPMNYTCGNSRFQTNIKKGRPHGNYVNTLGSVTGQDLYRNADGFTLWLEYAVDKDNPDEELYWLMWYDKDGKPTISMSAIFGKDELIKLAEQLIKLIP